MSSIPFPCAACGTQYDLTSDYVAQYGGQTTNCGECQAPMVVPTARGPLQPPPVPVAVLPYAGGYQPPTSGPTVYAEGKTTVATSGTHLPPLCVKCGQHTGDVKPLRRVLYWHQPALYLIFFFGGPLIYAIVALCVRERAVVHYSLCPKHLTARRNAMFAGWGVAAVGVALFFLYGMDLEALFEFRAGLIPLGIVLLIAGIVIALLSARTLNPKKIAGGRVWLQGTLKPFRDQLPVGGGYVR